MNRSKQFRNKPKANRIPKMPKYPKQLYYDKEFLLMTHEDALKQSQADGGTRYVVQSSITPVHQSSAKVELVRENQLLISGLTVDKVMTEKFLLCRVIAPAFKMAGLITVVDDPIGFQAARVGLYNYTADPGWIPLAECVNILPVGTVLAIKNPWLKKTLDGGLCVRSDNPTDIVVLDDAALQKLDPNLKWEGSIPPTYAQFMRSRPANDTDWKRRGNEHFVVKRYPEAIEAYTNGLKSDSCNIDLLSNRAVAYLNVEKFELALADTEEVLKLQPTHLKAIHRKTKALWGLQKYQQAKKFLDTDVVPIMPQDTMVRELLSKTHMMIFQSDYGEYPMEEIARMDCMEGESLEWADYQGPVQVKPTGDGRGRGMYATNKIATGQLILANKEYGFVHKDKGRDNVFVSANVETKHDDAQVLLVASIAHKLQNNPEHGKTLYSLYAGPSLGSLDPEKDDCSIVDMKRIDSICTYNSFGARSAFDIENDRFTGLWILPSYINHSCIDCNSFWTVYGNFILVRAFKDIEAGEEVTIAYTSPTYPYLERQKLFEKHGFQCKCSLCEYDRIEPESVRKEKEELLKEMSQADLYRNEESAKAAELLVSKISRLRPKYNLFLPQLNHLASYYMRVGEFDKAAVTLENCFDLLKHTSLRVQIFNATLNLMAAHAQCGRQEKAQYWFDVLQKLAISCWGTSEVIECVIGSKAIEVLKNAGIEFVLTD